MAHRPAKVYTGSGWDDIGDSRLLTHNHDGSTGGVKLPQSSITNLTTDLAAKWNAKVSDTAPTSPAEGDVWVDTTGSTTIAKMWNGSAWASFSSAGPAEVSGTTGSPTITSYTENGVNFVAYEWTGNGSVTFSKSGYVDLCLCAGGGGGGHSMGGGGGGGGIIAGGFAVSAGTVSIGIGGGGAAGASSSANGSNGGNTTFGTLTALGGGGGGSGSLAGSSGGAGGGGGANGGSVGAGGAGTNSQGRTGATAERVTPGDRVAGGGSGFYAPTTTRDGGRGAATGLTNTFQTFGGGGGGGVQNSTADISVAYDGGGVGGKHTGTAATAGATNKGGGGGGGADTVAGANGGSGRLIMRVRTN